MNGLIDREVLRELVFEALRKEPRTNCGGIEIYVEETARSRNVFPDAKECQANGINYSYYDQGKLNPGDKLAVREMVWDLIIDRVLTIGMDDVNDKWPFVRLTEFGSEVVSDRSPSYYDPGGYLDVLRASTPNLDPGIEQYVIEGLHCFRQRLFFAAGVMLGAAAEKSVLLLLQSIRDAAADQQEREDLSRLLERGRMPTIYKAIQDKIEALVKAQTLPYAVHQGCTEHLLSLFEMIRVQRNEAVHPEAGQVSKSKVFLTIQSFPACLETVARLTGWLSENTV